MAPGRWATGSGEKTTKSAHSTMTAQSVLAAALSIVERGQVRDLGVDYDRRSYIGPVARPEKL